MKNKSKRVKPDTDNSYDDTADIAITFCTTARIDKIIYKIRDDGNDIEMKLMPILLNRVFDDIIEEEFWAIAHEYKGVNFGKLKGLIGAECSRTLKAFIMRQDEC